MSLRNPLRSLRSLLASLLLALFASTTRADDEVISFFDTVFLPSAINIQTGDTVTWEWVEGDHILTSGLSSDPAENPGALFEVPINATNPSFSYTFNLPGVYSFFDALNENGLVGTIIVAPFTYEVGVVNNAFVPEVIDIFVGDQVRWQWIEGTHTVTSGVNLDPMSNPGALFDAPSSNSVPVFEFTFAAEGAVPYFCRPHLDCCGMTGVVDVQRLFVRGEVNGDGSINIADPIAIVGFLFNGDAPFECEDAADANDDGSINVADAITVINYLFLSSPAVLPDPFPAEGADRSSDPLRCR